MLGIWNRGCLRKCWSSSFILRSDHMNPPTTLIHTRHTHTDTRTCVLRNAEVCIMHLREVRESILMGGSCRAWGALCCVASIIWPVERPHSSMFTGYNSPNAIQQMATCSLWQLGQFSDKHLGTSAVFVALAKTWYSALAILWFIGELLPVF